MQCRNQNAWKTPVKYGTLGRIFIDFFLECTAMMLLWWIHVHLWEWLYILVSFCSLQSVLCEVKGQTVYARMHACIHSLTVFDRCMHRHTVWRVFLWRIMRCITCNSWLSYLNILKSRYWIYWRSKNWRLKIWSLVFWKKIIKK